MKQTEVRAMEELLREEEGEEGHVEEEEREEKKQGANSMFEILTWRLPSGSGDWQQLPLAITGDQLSAVSVLGKDSTGFDSSAVLGFKLGLQIRAK